MKSRELFLLQKIKKEQNTNNNKNPHTHTHTQQRKNQTNQPTTTLCIFALMTPRLFVKIVTVTVTALQNCLPICQTLWAAKWHQLKTPRRTDKQVRSNKNTQGTDLEPCPDQNQTNHRITAWQQRSWSLRRICRLRCYVLIAQSLTTHTSHQIPQKLLELCYSVCCLYIFKMLRC